MKKTFIDNLGIIPLAGICTYEEACKPGYSVDDNVMLMKRYNYTMSRLVEIVAAHIPRTPEWEIKCGFSLHIWLDAEHAAAIRKRISEMREPPLHLDKVPDEKLEVWLDELIRSDTTLELLIGIYRVARGELVRSIKQHLLDTNPLADHPTYRMLKMILQEQQEMLEWGEVAIQALTRTQEDAAANEAWERHLTAFLRDARGLSADLPQPESAHLPVRRSDGGKYIMDPIPRRDSRFKDHFNQSHSRYVDDDRKFKEMEGDEIALVLFYRRLRELDVPEWLAPVIYNTKGKPWEYYREMARQVWDECRHGMMGEAGFFRDGVAFYEYPVELEGSMTLNTIFTPLQSHLLLWRTEQNLMPKETGKRFEWVVAKETNDNLVTLYQDYDWADEVLHTQIGRRWLLPEFKTLEQMAAESEIQAAKWKQAMADTKLQYPQDEWWPTLVEAVRSRKKQTGSAAG